MWQSKIFRFSDGHIDQGQEGPHHIGAWVVINLYDTGEGDENTERESDIDEELMNIDDLL